MASLKKLPKKKIINPSVVLLCKSSFKLLIILIVTSLIILFFALIFMTLSYFLTKIGAVIVIFDSLFNILSIGFIFPFVQAWLISMFHSSLSRILLDMEKDNRIWIFTVKYLLLTNLPK